MKLFNAGAFTDYSGGRMPNDLVDFVKRKIGKKTNFTFFLDIGS